MNTVYLLGNPAGGGGRKRLDLGSLSMGYSLMGRSVIDLTGVDEEASNSALAAAVATSDMNRLVIAGGDGLVNLAVQHLAETSIAVGLLPAGTGNDFATALGIVERDLNSTLGPTTPVDLIKVETRESGAVARSWVASIAILGFPATINARANRLNVGFGSSVYPIAAAVELPSFERTVVDLTIDGDTITTDTAMLAIGNTRFFGGGMLACPSALPDDGLLHVTSIEGVGRIGILRHLLKRSGGSADRPEVLRRTAERIEISTPGLEVWGDGEPIGTTPLTLTVVPGALHVAGVNAAERVAKS